ncbi:vacuolar serine-type carboxypeptidase Atg42p [Trichomonascus vanleenenianus]|uniref:S10 family peptidase n=1 Tax=Trichomonascus vanleenenianus TaxID=2268995 RepID=UPI003ECABE04
MKLPTVSKPLIVALSLGTALAETWSHVVTKRELPNHVLKVTDPGSLGVDTVQQYSGYLDVEDGKNHLFFWFFESRNDPATDPVVLWLSGGPGCSSIGTALFFEMGPSFIEDSSLALIRNNYAWNNNASMIYLDQPVGTGFSWSDESGTPVDTSLEASKDVTAFLELFYEQFPQYKELPFHIATESYGGHYGPTFASAVHNNSNLHLDSLLVGNGLVDPLEQYPKYYDFACEVNDILNASDCNTMKSNISTCLAMLNDCYSNVSNNSACADAAEYCDYTQLYPYVETGMNLYDYKTPCVGPECYQSLVYVSEWLNEKPVQEAIGAKDMNFTSCNNVVNGAFETSGDKALHFQQYVSQLLDDDIPVLIYAGDLDFICNWVGNWAWVENLAWEGSAQFSTASNETFEVSGKAAGELANYDKFTFLRVYQAGHMVPHDQPEAALAMFNRWLSQDYSLST